MNRAVEMLQEEFDIEVPEFTVTGIRYESLFAHKWYLGTDNNIDPETAAKKIDEYLCQLNDDYMVERLEAIKDVIVEVLPVKHFMII